MKVLITTDLYVPTVNGVVSSVLTLRKELIERGHDVRILTLSQTFQSFDKDGVSYIGSIGAGKIYPGARIKTALISNTIQNLLDWSPDIIHSQCEFSTFSIAKKIAKALNIPIVHTYHTVYEDYTHYFLPNKKWGRLMVAFLSRMIINKADSVIAPTEKVYNLLKGYGIKRTIRVAPSGIDLHRFSKAQDKEKILALKRKLHIPSDSRILLYVGRLAKEKSIEELLRYHAKCQDKNMIFLIVGDGPHRAAIEKEVLKLGIGNSVRFTGMVPPEEVCDYYHLGDLFVSASGSETQGLTYIEALSSGLPALCYKDKCLEGVIMNGINGWQYENEADYMEKLETYFSDEAMRESMSEKAAECAINSFSAETFAQNVEAVYIETLYNIKEHSKKRFSKVNLCQ